MALLLGIRVLCKAGCKVVFGDEKRQVTYNKSVILTGYKPCNPPISLLLKAINAGFLNGAQHLNAQMVRKYLMPSLATSKGHMKRPYKGLWSTTPKIKPTLATQPLPAPLPRPIVPAHYHNMPGLIPNDYSKNSPNNHSFHTVEGAPIANVFCFGAFADKVIGVVYNN